MKHLLQLSFLLLVLASVQGFVPIQTQQPAPTRTVPFSTRRASGDSGIPQNATTTTTEEKKTTVYVNPNYVAPVIVTPAALSSSQPSVHQKSSLLQGGHYFLEMGESLRQMPPDNKLMREAGAAFQELGIAWQSGDWEAVTYASLEASLTMKLLAQSLNKRCEGNDLQQAYAGVAVELLALSNCHQASQAAICLRLQGLSLRLYQASRSATDDQTSRSWEEASRAARSLAKLQGANGTFLPRRFQLWWHDRKQSSKTNHHPAENAFE